MATRPERSSSWEPRIGAWPEGSGVRFRVWAPTHERVEVLPESDGAAASRLLLSAEEGGTFTGVLPGARAGLRYRYLLDGDGPFPDPASRFQPDGVHGPSQVVDPGAFAWSDDAWRGVELRDLALYEVHVGTLTREGTFAAAADRLPYLRELGVTAIELMPVAAFAGRWNWGYDGVCLFAPASCYGAPDDLRRLVDAAHTLGLGVLLDVVYNHFGPDGAYVGRFGPSYFSATHHTPWGAAVNLDGDGADAVRQFFIENALHWLHEYHVDGLRFDATHALIDDSPTHLLSELAGRVRASIRGRTVLLTAEDDRNLAAIVRPQAAGGWGLDAVWSDDFHHEIRRLAAGDRDGYFQDFSGSAADVAATIRRGWFYTGQHSAHRNAPRGTDPSSIAVERFIFFLQNHDQVGNRAFGERLNQQIAPPLFRALTALLLLIPETPLLFMGQEWAASTPFLYFTDHHPELGRLVTEGRRAEFAKFDAFSDDRLRARIPDPQAEETFRASRLDWAEADREPHAGMLRLHRALLSLRQAEAALRAPANGEAAAALDDDTLAVHRTSDEDQLLLLVRFRGAGVGQPDAALPRMARSAWRIVLTTEDSGFAEDPAPPRIESTPALTVRFARPSAILLRRS